MHALVPVQSTVLPVCSIVSAQMEHTEIRIQARLRGGLGVCMCEIDEIRCGGMSRIE